MYCPWLAPLVCNSISSLVSRPGQHFAKTHPEVSPNRKWAQSGSGYIQEVGTKRKWNQTGSQAQKTGNSNSLKCSVLTYTGSFFAA